MDWSQVIPVAVSLIVALLGLWKAKLASQGKKDAEAIIDAVIEGIEAAGNAATKDAVNAGALKAGVGPSLDLILSRKGFIGPMPKSGS